MMELPEPPKPQSNLETDVKIEIDDVQVMVNDEQQK